jgi:hypothetical protein
MGHARRVKPAQTREQVPPSALADFFFIKILISMISEKVRNLQKFGLKGVLKKNKEGLKNHPSPNCSGNYAHFII